jgi:ISXO2-like transposase domain
LDIFSLLNRHTPDFSVTASIFTQRILKSCKPTVKCHALASKTRKVRTKVIPDTKKETLTKEIKANVEKGSTVYSDGHDGYEGLMDEDYVHPVIEHATKSVNGQGHVPDLLDWN